MILKKGTKVKRINSGIQDGTEGTVVDNYPVNGLGGELIKELGVKIPPDHKLEAVYIVKWHDASWFPSIMADYYVEENK